jgi:hypothetical protein
MSGSWTQAEGPLFSDFVIGKAEKKCLAIAHLFLSFAPGSDMCLFDLV